MAKKKTTKNQEAAAPSSEGRREKIHSVQVDGLYQDWFLDYASYVILERAVPRVEDGFKPVQRRIMHALEVMDDGRFNKVANVIGSTMQYHPHGDAAIGEAIVNLGQKDLLFDTQGNWGDVRTGDSAAAPRYIEVRLSKLAKEVVFNPQTTEWQLSYDGRKKEPVTLPVKFPLLLAQGVEGIAVGLSTRILPHNFNELIKASIDILKGKNPKIYPDFPTGGIADFAEYDQGYRGGKVKVRARIEVLDKKTLLIREIPFGTTTASLMESIVKASEKGKIKVRQVVDNTASQLEIVVHLQPGQAPEIAMDALYAFTDCEVSISPNACVIIDDKPRFLRVNEILKVNTEQTVDLLRRELEIRREELMEKILFSSLEKIFIENRIYRDIEECESWEEVISTIDAGLKPHKKKFYREITRDDIIRLTEIKIKRISRYDSFKADEMLRDLENELKEVNHHLKHLVEYAISYYQGLLDRFGKGRERRTEIRSFQSVTATEVIANNQKLYVNRADGFVGWGLRKDECICECSELDDIIVIRRDGVALVNRISEKKFMGKDILYAGVWRKGDERMVYNLIYSDGKSGKSFAKRFAMPAIIREKEYVLHQGNANSRVQYLSANPNGEAEVVEVKLTPSSTARKKVFEFDFSELDVKGRGARGITLTKYPVRKVDFKEAKGTTLSGLPLWFEEASGRLNKDKRGRYVGKFHQNDLVLAINRSGNYKITGFDLTNRYDGDNRTLLIEKFSPKKVITAVYWDGESKQHFVKRFLLETTTIDKEFNFISEGIGSRLEFVSTAEDPEVEITIAKGKSGQKETQQLVLSDLIDVKGWKAMGNRLSNLKVAAIRSLDESGEQEVPEGDEDEVAEESPKKKEPSLLDEPKESRTESQESPAKIPEAPSAQVEQAELFPSEKVPVKATGKNPAPPRVKTEKKPKQGKGDGGAGGGGKTYQVGDTIDLDL